VGCSNKTLVLFEGWFGSLVVWWFGGLRPWWGKINKVKRSNFYMDNKDFKDLLDFDDLDSSNKAIDLIMEEALKKVKNELPNLPKHVQEIQKSRGAGLESAIMSEQVFNHILAYMGYHKEKIITLSYGKKIEEMIKILKESLKEDQWLKETIDSLLKIKSLRNIYAHTPGDYQRGELRFNPSEEYYKKEDEEFRFKPLNELNNIFADLDEDLRGRTIEILKRLVPIREKEKLQGF